MVNYQFSGSSQVQKIQGLDSADSFSKNGDILLKIPQQVIRKNIVTFSVKPLYKNINKVNVFLRFKGNPKEIKLGIKGSEDQQYTYRTLYQNILNPLTFQKEGEVSFWQKSPDFKSFSDFTNNLPTTKLIGYYNFDPTQLIVAVSSKPGQNLSTVVNKTLRGSHTFFVKVTQSPFILKIDKQDANMYDGEDKLLISVEKNNQILAEKEIPDDGMVNTNGLQLAPQSQEIKIDNAQNGIYKITLKDESAGSDIRIKKIEVNQRGLIFKSPVFVVDTNPTTFITNSKNISLQTNHKEGMQTVKLDTQYKLIVDKINTKFSWFLDATPSAFLKANRTDNKKDIHTLTMPLNDLILNGDGNFAFDSDSYFNLNLSNFVDVNKIKSTDNVDYIVANYQPAVKKDDWYEATVAFSPDDFKLQGDNLYFSLESPELSNNGGEITIDSLEVSVSKP